MPKWMCLATSPSTSMNGKTIMYIVRRRTEVLNLWVATQKCVCPSTQKTPPLHGIGALGEGVLKVGQGPKKKVANLWCWGRMDAFLHSHLRSMVTLVLTGMEILLLLASQVTWRPRSDLQGENAQHYAYDPTCITLHYIWDTQYLPWFPFLFFFYLPLDLSEGDGVLHSAGVGLLVGGVLQLTVHPPGHLRGGVTCRRKKTSI